MVAAIRALPLLLALLLAIGPLPAQAEADAAAARTKPPAGLLTPVAMVTGMRLAAASDQVGTPVISGRMAFRTFMFPSAIAARWPDVYVVDSGARSVYRVDMNMQVMLAVPGAVALPGTRAQVAVDHTLYLLDPLQTRIKRFSRGGAALSDIRAIDDLERPSEFAVDSARGRVFVVDGLTQRLFEFHSAGRGYQVIGSVGGSAGDVASAPSGKRVYALGAIAVAGETLLALDPGCPCVAELDRDGTVLRSFGREQLRLPAALAVDRNLRVFVVDAADHTLKVFQNGRLLATYTAPSLNVVQFSGIAVDESRLYVADGPGARFAVFRIGTPREAED